MINIDSTLLIQMLNFLIIFFIGKKMIIDPVLSTVKKRDEKIESLNKQAAKLRSEVEKYKNEYEEKFEQVRLEAANYHKQAKDEAIQEAEKMYARVKAEMDDKLENAKKEIEQQKEKAKVALKSDAEDMADEIVNKIIGKVA